MNRSMLLLASLASVASLNFHPTPCLAQDDTADTSMAAFQFSGLVNSDNVYVRSGASETDYPVLKLSKGDTLIVVGAKGDWLKVVPPQSVFCVVGKVWVEKRADGTIGRVREGSTNANVRVASNVNEQKSHVVSQLKPGEDVKIIGELDEYFKITPPANAFVYVHKKFVDVVKRVEVVTKDGKLELKQNEPSVAAAPPKPMPSPTPENATPAPQPPSIAMAPTTQQATTAPSMAAAPTTAPLNVASTEAFDALEAKFTAASKMPLEKQPVDELVSGYKKVIDEHLLPDSMMKIAKFRLSGLEVRRDAVAQFKESKKAADAIAARQMPLQAEANELDQRMKANQIRTYAAIGTLRTSSIFYNGKPLFRLTDPASGRTVVYVADADAKLQGMEGSFIGLRGTVTDDATRQIKYVMPQSSEVLDPTELSSGRVSSTLIPASLTPRAGAE